MGQDITQVGRVHGEGRWQTDPVSRATDVGDAGPSPLRQAPLSEG